MTHPRLSIPGATYLVTRTTNNSLFLLVPGPVVNGIMEYCLALAAKDRGVLIHAVSIESNHFHLVVTDPDEQLADFMKEFNRTTARCLLAYYKKRFPKRRLDSVWAPGRSYSAQHLVNQAAIIKAVCYTLTNPVKDALVPDYRKWPGFNTRPNEWRGCQRQAERPGYYFKHTDERLAYRITAPPQLGPDASAAATTVEQHLRDEQDALVREVRSQGRSFLGAKAALRVAPMSSPESARPSGNLDPHLAAGGDAEAMQVAAKALQLFRLAYREAWTRFKKGLDAVFPGGTLLMRRRFQVPCERLDACWCEVAVPS